jgi:predicted lipid-binding transport protein (Tim44 family)
MGVVIRLSLRALFLASLASVLAAAPAMAAAGGGSAGFGGGGGGGGGSGGGDGGGWILLLLFIIQHPILLLLILIAVAVFVVIGWLQGVRYRARRRARVKRVQLAAAEASQDDAAFAPEIVNEQAAKLFLEIQAAWDARDRTKLKDMVGSELMVEWERRLDDLERRGWHNRVQVQMGPAVEFVGLTNRAEDDEDRVVVRIEATLTDYVVDGRGRKVVHNEATSDSRTLTEYWTLCKRERDGHWMLLSIEQKAEGDHHLEGEMVVTPWDDVARLRDQALVEGANADKLAEGERAADYVSVSYADDARAAALDLSLVDARFAPDVLEVAVRRVVAAWTEAVDGPDDALTAIATPQALGELLHPGDASKRTRLVVRGPRIVGMKIEALGLEAQPPRMTVAVEAEGARYIEDRDTTAVLSGNRSTPIRFTERWTLALEGDEANPWRIVSATAGALPARASA